MGCENRINGHMTHARRDKLIMQFIHPFFEVLRVQNLAS